MTKLKQDMLLEIESLKKDLDQYRKICFTYASALKECQEERESLNCKHKPVVVMMPDEIKTSGPYIEVTDFRVDCKTCGSQLKSKGWEKL